MEKFVIFLAIALCGTNAIHFDEAGSNRISNGNQAPFNIFPFSISLQRIADAQTESRGHRCGGALITFQHVLTAASCLYDFVNGDFVPITTGDYRVFSGVELLDADDDQNRIRFIANVTVHPAYFHAPAYLNNIAVITLSAPFPNTTVSPVGLPVPTFNPADFTLCQIASWGAQNSGQVASNSLQYTTKYIYSQSLCQMLYNQMSGHVNIFSSMVCAASFDIISSGCIGDEGTPMVCNGGLTGILFQTNMCATSSYPEVYTRVSNYTDWIRSISGSSTFRPELIFFGIIVIAIAMFINKA